MDEGDLRGLSDWSHDRDSVRQAQDELREARIKMKRASKRLADARAERRATCPIPLDDTAYRFWSKVNIVDDATSCWEFAGSRRSTEGEEYGIVRHEGKIIGAHRLSYLLVNGELPEVARHTCDNPPCVRPSHLLSGTHADNMRDRQERGRYAWRDQRGEKNPATTLTDIQVLEARRRARVGVSHREVAEWLGVSRHNATFAITGRSFAHLNDIEAPVRRPNVVLKTTDLPDIIASRLRGETLARIGGRYGVTGSAVRQFIERNK